jgi:hypothetical protein
MDKAIEDRIENHRGQYDHIVWYGICQRCGSPRYLFMDEMRLKHRYGYRDDMRDKEFQCKGGRCTRMVKMKGKLPESKAVHLSDIKRR